MDILKRTVYALNRIPNYKDIGPNGEASYDIVAALDKHIKRKDNPVPSLDLDHYKKFLIKLGYSKDGPIMYAHLSPLIDYLKQYGVETNKVQPNCKYIKREGESCTLNDNCKYPNCEEDNYLG